MNDLLIVSKGLFCRERGRAMPGPVNFVISDPDFYRLVTGNSAFLSLFSQTSSFPSNFWFHYTYFAPRSQAGRKDTGGSRVLYRKKEPARMMESKKQNSKMNIEYRSTNFDLRSELRNSNFIFPFKIQKSLISVRYSIIPETAHTESIRPKCWISTYARIRIIHSMTPRFQWPMSRRRPEKRRKPGLVPLLIKILWNYYPDEFSWSCPGSFSCMV